MFFLIGNGTSRKNHDIALANLDTTYATLEATTWRDVLTATGNAHTDPWYVSMRDLAIANASRVVTRANGLAVRTGGLFAHALVRCRTFRDSDQPLN